MSRRAYFTVIYILTFCISGILTPGCGHSQLTSPAIEPEILANSHSPANNHLVWDYGRIIFDLRNESAEIIPSRELLGHLNIINFLENGSKIHIGLVPGSLVANAPAGTLDVDVQLTHPFPGLIRFTGFDVRLIIIGGGSLQPFPDDPSLVMPDRNETHLVNADGYTRWWNPREFIGQMGYIDGRFGKPDSIHHYQSTLNGYKYFADGLAADADVGDPLILTNRGRFSTIAINTRHFAFQFGPQQNDFLIFNYAVDANWHPPTVKPPTSMDDFPRSANSLEPFNIRVTEKTNSLYYDPDLTQCPKTGGVLRLQLDVFTWQGIDGIGEVMVGCPDMAVDYFAATEVDGYTEYGAHVSVYSADIIPDQEGSLHPMVMISATGKEGTYSAGPNNFPLVFNGPPDAVPALYQIYYPTVSSNSPPIVENIVGPIYVVAGETYEYSANYYDCQDLKNYLTLSWEIGDDNPPLYNDGYGNTNGLFTHGDGTIDITFPLPGTYVVDLMVTDTGGKKGYSTGPLTAKVSTPSLPILPEGTNLSLNLDRTALFSYEYFNNPQDIPAIVLAWDGSLAEGDIVEWVIYRDNDAFDGVENWEEIGVTQPAVWTFSNRLTGEHGYNSGGAYYFKVHARSLAGSPQSESATSTEWAFIEFENAEISGPTTDQHPWIMGYGGTNSSYFRQWERPGNQGAVSGGCYMMDPDDPYMRQYTWSVIASPELPILTDSALAQTTEEWIIELIFGAQSLPMNESWGSGMKYSVGTVPDDPSTHNTNATYTAYEEALPGDYLAGQPYFTSYYQSSMNSRFDESASSYNDRYGWGQDEYGWPFNWARFRLRDLNPNGAGMKRAAIGFGSGSINDPIARPRADEIAVIIY